MSSSQSLSSSELDFLREEVKRVMEASDSALGPSNESRHRKKADDRAMKDGDFGRSQKRDASPIRSEVQTNRTAGYLSNRSSPGYQHATRPPVISVSESSLPSQSVNMSVSMSGVTGSDKKKKSKWLRLPGLGGKSLHRPHMPHVPRIPHIGGKSSRRRKELEAERATNLSLVSDLSLRDEELDEERMRHVEAGSRAERNRQLSEGLRAELEASELRATDFERQNRALKAVVEEADRQRAEAELSLKSLTSKAFGSPAGGLEAGGGGDGKGEKKTWESILYPVMMENATLKARLNAGSPMACRECVLRDNRIAELTAENNSSRKSQIDYKVLSDVLRDRFETFRRLAHENETRLRHQLQAVAASKGMSAKDSKAGAKGSVSPAATAAKSPYIQYRCTCGVDGRKVLCGDECCTGKTNKELFYKVDGRKKYGPRHMTYINHDILREGWRYGDPPHR